MLVANKFNFCVIGLCSTCLLYPWQPANDTSSGFLQEMNNSALPKEEKCSFKLLFVSVFKHVFRQFHVMFYFYI